MRIFVINLLLVQTVITASSDKRKENDNEIVSHGGSPLLQLLRSFQEIESSDLVSTINNLKSDWDKRNAKRKRETRRMFTTNRRSREMTQQQTETENEDIVPDDIAKQDLRKMFVEIYDQLSEYFKKLDKSSRFTYAPSTWLGRKLKNGGIDTTVLLNNRTESRMISDVMGIIGDVLFLETIDETIEAVFAKFGLLNLQNSISQSFTYVMESLNKVFENIRLFVMRMAERLGLINNTKRIFSADDERRRFLRSNWLINKRFKKLISDGVKIDGATERAALVNILKTTIEGLREQYKRNEDYVVKSLIGHKLQTLCVNLTSKDEDELEDKLQCITPTIFGDSLNEGLQKYNLKFANLKKFFVDHFIGNISETEDGRSVQLFFDLLNEPNDVLKGEDNIVGVLRYLLP